MQSQLKISSPWSQLAVFLVLLGGGFFLYSVLSLAIINAAGMSVSSFSALNLEDSGKLNLMKWLQAISSVVVFLIPALGYALFSFRNRRLYYLGWKPAQRANMYVLAIIALVLALPFVFLLGEWNRDIPLSDWMRSMESDASKQMEAFLRVRRPTDILVNLLIIALLPAITEELCFRGALQRIMIHITRRPWAGIIITGFLFSAMHFQFEGFLPRMFLGIVLGALYWFSGSIWTSILGHFVNNAVQVIIVSYAPKFVDTNPSLPLFAGVVSGLTVFGILYFYQKQSTVSYNKVYQPDQPAAPEEWVS